MDILVSSNLERLLYYGCGDVKIVKELMNNLDKKGLYNVDESFDNILDDFYGASASEIEVSESIKEVYEKYNYLIDTHTAVAYNVYRKYQKDTNDNIPTVVVSTAHPYKFPKTIASSIGLGEYSDEFEAIKALIEKTKIEEPEMIKKLYCSFPKTVWKLEESYQKIKELLMELNNE